MRASAAQLLIACVLLTGCVATPMETDAAEAARTTSLAEGDKSYAITGRGTFVTWATLDGAVPDESGRFEFVLEVRVTGPAATPYYVNAFSERKAGELVAGTGMIGFGEGTMYISRFGPSPAPARLLVVFGAMDEGPWLVTLRLAEGPRSSLPDAAAAVPVELQTAPTAFAILDPRTNTTHEVNIRDERGNAVAGAYTSGALTFAAAIPTSTPGLRALTSINHICGHEGEGRWRVSLRTAATQESAGIYSRELDEPTFGLTQEVWRPGELVTRFEPLYDPWTACAIHVATIPLEALDITARILHDEDSLPDGLPASPS